VSTRAELVIEPDALDGLPEAVAARLLIGLGLDQGALRITAQEERALSQNRALCAEHLQQMVAAALAPPPPPRRATRPGRAARARRIATKRQRSDVKRLRQPPSDAP
jgi:ribosome-associated protein